MEEKTYKVMRAVAGWDIAIGVISIIIGLAAGVMLILSGAKLIATKSKLLF
ncbi:MAG: hypothetical protein K6G57_01215 [Lachnospiraceae bacterium]|nr:hypothetical protein [Lachnospiraceae bacterium]